MSTVEPILYQQVKPPVSNNTYKTTYDVLSDLTFRFGKDRGCEGLHELWVKVKSPADPDYGNALPEDYLKHGQSNNIIPPPPGGGGAVHGMSPLPSPPSSLPSSRRPSEPMPVPLSQRMNATPKELPPSPGVTGFGGGGPTYADLPDHHEDMRRLIEECTAAKESARVLQEALVYTRPEELEHKAVIREFYTKCVLAHESLTNQMDWAQSEAARSRRVANSVDGPHHSTAEENALALLFEAHGILTDALKQHDDLEKMAADDREIRSVQERSKKDTRMDRRQQMDMLTAPEGGSSSRSPSPSGYNRALPDVRDSQLFNDTRHLPEVPTTESFSSHLQAAVTDRGVSRTPSPDGRRSAHQLPQLPPPKPIASPPRSGSPLGRSRMQGPRPLPNPFKTVNSSQSLTTAAADARELQPAPSRGHSGSTHEGGSSGTGEDEDDEARPSRKALGKRRAIPDPDSELLCRPFVDCAHPCADTFDPNDLFATTTTTAPAKPKSDTGSEHSITADDLYLAKPVKYAYDAWAESEATRKERGAADKAAGLGITGTSPPPPDSAKTPVSPTVLGPRDPRSGPTPANQSPSPMGITVADPVAAR